MNQPQFTMHTTTEYSSIKHYAFNREINQANLKKIIQSIKKEGLKQPIAVTSDGYIYDGQHRFMALRELGLPLWLYINHNATAEDMLLVNRVRKDHSIRDLVWYYANRGDVTMQKLLELQDHWEKKGFSEGVIYNSYFDSSGHSHQSAIRNNTYSLNEEFGNKILENLMFLDEFIPKAKSNTFARAMKKIMLRNPSFSPRVLINKAKLVKLNIYGNEKDLRQEIVDVYNYKTRKNKIHI